jgi:hypothetical protein
MALTKESWLPVIEEYFNKDNSVIRLGKNWNTFMNEYAIHLAQAGSPSDVTVDPSSFPLTAGTRTDADRTFYLHVAATTPKYGVKLDDAELSYDKMASILSQDLNYLLDTVSDNILYYWTPTGSTRKVYTTGSARTTDADGATGNRKAITFADVQNAYKTLSKDGVKGRRALVVSPNFAKDLKDLDQWTGTELVTNNFAIDGEFIGKIGGFEVYERRSVGVSTITNSAATTDSIQAPTYTGTTACELALAFGIDNVGSATGDVEIFMDQNSPLYQGDVISLAVRYGGGVLRNDEKGVVRIVEFPA